MNNYLGVYLRIVNMEGLNIENAYRLIEAYIDSYCQNKQLIKKIDKRALPFLASELLKSYNKDRG